MRNAPFPGSRWRRAFTLVELLVVVAVIGVIVSLLLPAIGGLKSRVLISRAEQEMNNISSAIRHYEEVYGRWPVSQRVQGTASPLGEDYTFGSTFYRKDGTRVVIGGPGQFLNNNNEVMAILLDLEYYANGQPTPNKDHICNPHRTLFLDPHPASGTNDPGLGPDGAYRDPWGLTYMITLDLNNDGRARDVFYRNPLVSGDPHHPDLGLNGLLKTTDAKSNDVFEANAPIVVWSPGPDGRIDTEKKANEGANKDNLLTWK